MLQHGRARAPQKIEPPIIAGRVPPHNLDAEAAVLSAILLGGRDSLDRVLEILKPDHFYSDANGKIYEAAQTLALDNGSFQAQLRGADGADIAARSAADNNDVECFSQCRLRKN